MNFNKVMFALFMVCGSVVIASEAPAPKSAVAKIKDFAHEVVASTQTGFDKAVAFTKAGCDKVTAYSQESYRGAAAYTSEKSQVAQSAVKAHPYISTGVATVVVVAAVYAYVQSSDKVEKN
ncbi:hypothetical protein KBC04_01055 [Candidatus Babeliales bacterium]|nr:hypothetical protein [Candidatus Babeliales bacterium]MBP9843676.1 hypothetical protein [Candidatus Babeliales bacterium]